MTTNPPALIETLVGCFLPPACREEVLGDLCESCDTPARYVISALAVIPRVIFSQIRRNTDAGIFLLTACAIAYSLRVGSPALSSDSGHSLLLLAIPVVPALLGLLICNGFAPLEERRLHAVTFDVVVAMAAAASTQFVLVALVQKGLMLPAWCPSPETAWSWLSIIVLRAIFPPGAKLPPAHRSLS